MSINVTEDRLQELGFIIDPTGNNSLIRLEDLREPTKDWGLDELARFAGASLRQGEANHLAAVQLSRTSAVSLFWAGRALNLAKKLLRQSDPEKKWMEWLKEKGIKTTTASKARRLARFAESVEDIQGMTLTAALRKYGILPPRDEKPAVFTAPASTKPSRNGAPKKARHRRTGKRRPDARRARETSRNSHNAPSVDPDGDEAGEEDRRVFTCVWGDEGGDEDPDFQISTFILLHLAYLLWDQDLTDEAIEAGAEVSTGLIHSLRKSDWGTISIPQLDKLAAWLLARRKENDD